MNKFIPFITVLAVIIMSSAGCYTVLQHPAVEEYYTQSDYQVACIDCHSDYHEYPYGYFYGYYPDYWWDTPRWGRYYAYPWWWDHYWFDDVRYYHDDDYDGNLSPRSSSGKKVERRSTLSPPYSHGTTTIQRSTGSVSSGSGSGSSTGKKSGDTGQTKTKEETNEQKEDEKKAVRRGGRSR